MTVSKNCKALVTKVLWCSATSSTIHERIYVSLDQLRSINVFIAGFFLIYMRCPVCLVDTGLKMLDDLTDHFLAMEKMADPGHVMWLNRHIGRKATSRDQLIRNMRAAYETGGDLKLWMIKTLVARIYGEPPHPFIVRFQHPNPKLIYGYVMEHHHFLKQWVKSCSEVIAKTDAEDVQLYELENIISEFMGKGEDQPSHHELLLRTGESIGLDRSTIYASSPLASTEDCLAWWARIARECSWVEIMAAMHTLELTANPEIKRFGAKLTYFDPTLLEDQKYSLQLRSFLSEGYRADAGHSMEALQLIVKYCDSTELERNVQSVTFKTTELLDNYLMARLERGEQYGN